MYGRRRVVTVTCARRAAGVMLGVGILALASAAGTLGDTSASCSTSGGFDETTADAALLASCGIVKVPVSSSMSLPGGGTLYEYQTPYGQTLYVPSTPHGGVDASAAAPTVQAQYGVPPAPPRTAAALYRTWAASASRWVVNPAPPQFLYGNTQAPTQITASATSGELAGGGGWAGYANTPTGWTVADANYAEPGTGATRCSNDGVYLWSGIGGVGNDKMGQTGTELGLNGWDNGSAWIETDPSNTSPPYQYPGDPTASKGDAIIAVSQWTGSYYEFTLYINGSPHTVGESGNWSSGDATAEEIIEAPAGHDITNFGTVNMYGYNGQGYSPLASHPTEEFTTGGIDTGALSGASFQVTQTNCAG